MTVAATEYTMSARPSSKCVIVSGKYLHSSACSFVDRGDAEAGMFGPDERAKGGFRRAANSICTLLGGGAEWAVFHHHANTRTAG